MFYLFDRLCQELVTKTRYIFEYTAVTWQWYQSDTSKWHFIVLLIFVYLINNESENVFVCWRTIFISYFCFFKHFILLQSAFLPRSFLLIFLILICTYIICCSYFSPCHCVLTVNGNLFYIEFFNVVKFIQFYIVLHVIFDHA